MQIRLLGNINVSPDRVYVDHGVSGRQAVRPGLENAINASRDGDEFCVALLDGLSDSAGDLHQTVERFAKRAVALSIDGKVHDPADPMGKMFIGILGLMAEFESGLIRARTRDAIAAAAASGRMKGRPHTCTLEEWAYLLQAYERRQFKIETTGRNTGLNRSALYDNLALARTERDAISAKRGTSALGSWHTSRLPKLRVVMHTEMPRLSHDHVRNVARLTSPLLQSPRQRLTCLILAITRSVPIRNL